MNLEELIMNVRVVLELLGTTTECEDTFKRPKRWIRDSTRWAFYHRDNRRCTYCGKEIRRVDDLSLDHVIPWLWWHAYPELKELLGGPHSVWNLVTSCKRCNTLKGERHPLLYYMARYGNDAQMILESLIKRNYEVELDRDMGSKLAELDAALHKEKRKKKNDYHIQKKKERTQHIAA